MASEQPINVSSKGLLADQIEWLKERSYNVNTAQGVVLTDNFNPLEHLQTEKSEHYRHVLVGWFGADLLVR